MLLALEGALALRAGDVDVGIDALSRAAASLPVHAFGGAHGELWFALGRAYFDRGRHAEGREWFTRVVEHRAESAFNPLPYVRSLYFLGRIHEADGEMDEALEHYRRFHTLWADGEMDLDRVEEVAEKLR